MRHEEHLTRAIRTLLPDPIGASTTSARRHKISGAVVSQELFLLLEEFDAHEVIAL